MQQDDPGKVLDKNSPQVLSLLKNRMFVIIAGSVLVLGLALGIYGIFILRDRTASDDLPPGSEIESSEAAAGDSEVAGVVEVLPQNKRSIDNDDDVQGWSAFNPGIDPFSDPMRLTGVVTGGRSCAMAIIESSGTSYIVSEGDYVDDLWAVRQITGESVVMRAHNQEVMLFFDQPPVMRSLDPELEMEEDDPEEGS